ncbi:MAG: hypothetical protein U9N63_11605 [Pseudomonadota bacterium]|nr:hypothetical protein [Pseudomonadota bacterium]
MAEKKAKAAKKLKQLKKKRPDIKPVVINGNTLARTWWGKSWNKNLERYADFSNRIGRGRSYLRHGAVLDLKIEPGKVISLVQGSTAKPYAIEITIKPISPALWASIKNQCQGELKSLQDLLAGRFPKELGEIFFAQGEGLFPVPKEISFDCSCPDWASMCKHVAATLYGVGARFDEDPALFFKLRGADTKDLISRAIKDKTDELLKKTRKKSAKVIEDADLSDIFGIEMDKQPNFSKKPTKSIDPPAKRSSKTIDPSLKQKKQKKVISQQKIPKTKKTTTGLVAELIISNKSGITIEKLVEKTGYSKIKLYGIVHRLKQQNKIKNEKHGVYIKA